MDIDISKNISSVKAQIPSSHHKKATKEVPAPHKNEEIARNAEKVEQETQSVKTVKMSYDTDIDRVIFTVVDSRSQEVVRRIPGTDSITFMKRFQQMIKEMTNKRV
jgi:uncharacterized FlaG/YvyC family protein